MGRKSIVLFVFCFITIVFTFIKCVENTGIIIPEHFPQSNRLSFDTVSKDAIILGEALFFDKRLSKDNSISCASCHKPDLAFTDGVKRSKGIRNNFSRRNSLTLINVGFNSSFMYDERAFHIDIQSFIPLLDSHEMDMTLKEIENKLNQDNQLNKLSKKAYKLPLNLYTISNSLGAYMKSLVSAQTKYDLFAAKGDSSLFSDEEKAGYKLFKGKAQCANCHVPPLFTNYQYYNLNIIQQDTSDYGRMLNTLEIKDKYTFKTPTLRNVAITAPYFHTGEVASLDSALSFHLSLNRKTLYYSPPALTKDERKSIIVFLNTLTDRQYMK